MTIDRGMYRIISTCVRCGSRPAVEGGLCTLDIIFLARRATRAFDAAQHDPEKAAEWLKFNHDQHSPPIFMGCPFCALPAP